MKGFECHGWSSFFLARLTAVEEASLPGTAIAEQTYSLCYLTDTMAATHSLLVTLGAAGQRSAVLSLYCEIRVGSVVPPPPPLTPSPPMLLSWVAQGLVSFSPLKSLETPQQISRDHLYH